MTATRERGWGQRRMSTSEDGTDVGDNSADSIDSTDNRNSGTNSDAGDSSGDGATDIWARAELPLSNDAQVEQATGAVWKVGNALPLEAWWMQRLTRPAKSSRGQRTTCATTNLPTGSPLPYSATTAALARQSVII